MIKTLKSEKTSHLHSWFWSCQWSSEVVGRKKWSWYTTVQTRDECATMKQYDSIGPGVPETSPIPQYSHFHEPITSLLVYTGLTWDFELRNPGRPDLSKTRKPAMDFLCSREKAHILSQVKVLHAVASPLPQLIHTRDPAPGFSSSLEFPDIADTLCVFQFCALDAPPVSVCLISSKSVIISPFLAGEKRPLSSP